jgi:glycosylphosphatidylinositol transamidase
LFIGFAFAAQIFPDDQKPMALKCEFSSQDTTCPPRPTANTMPAAIRNLRNNPHTLFVRLPNILSFICIVVGVVWLLLLPLNEYSRNTYISENALLPGQVHAYFTGSEQNIFRGYKRELEGLLNEGQDRGGQKDEAEVTAT